MGGIQNSLNSMLATLMGAAVAGQHIHSQRAQVESAERVELAGLEEQIPESEEEIAKQEVNVKEAQLRSEAVAKGFNPDTLTVDAAAGTYAGPMRLDTTTLEHDKKMAAQALKTAQGVLEGKQAQLKLKKKRFEDLTKRYGGSK